MIGRTQNQQAVLERLRHGSSLNRHSRLAALEELEEAEREAH